MSNQQTLEQKRASFAWQKIQDVKSNLAKKAQEEYSSLAKKAPADIQTNGLGQTTAFWRAKGFENGNPKDGGKNPHAQLLSHLTEWLKTQDALSLPTDNLVEWVSKNAQVDDYRRATTESIAFLVWLKRFAEAELP
jgi:CRISPR-associated protein Cmr5